MMDQRNRMQVLRARIDILTWDDALGRLLAWGHGRESRYVCICNVHSVVSAGTDAAFGRVVEEADMATPDGAPVAWLMRRLGVVGQARVNGPDLMWRYCALSACSSEVARLGHSLRSTQDTWGGLPSIFLYGGSEETLAILRERLVAEFPLLNIAGMYSPPFRTSSAEEESAAVEMINRSGAGVVWVSLGCPKQEYWMAANRGRVQAVMVGVGAAFDYHAGTLKRAPPWMQRAGLEWLHRLASEPRRLWRRYLVTNTLFVLGAAKQLLRG